ncbi:cell division protein FtsW [Spirochaetia bacterium]|nr:cell division protein FtsW [Spirochaetia bacterium]
MVVDQLHMESSGRRLRFDHFLVASILLLTGLGLVTLYSASYAFAGRLFGDPHYFISRQVILGAVGIGFFIIASIIPLKLLRKFIMPLVLGAVGLCLLTFIPGIGVSKNGAARWIQIGASNYQPSELVKLVLPLYLAHIFDKKREQIDVFTAGVLPPALVVTLFFVLIYLQNNFSTALFIAVNALFIFFLAGVKLRYFFGAAVILLPISAYMVLTREHRLRRLISYIWPDLEPLGAGYQVRASVLTIGSGGVWGKGIGQGTRKMASVPEIQSDFIFSAYAEEFGLVGILLFYLVFFFFALRGYRAALRSDDGFKRLLALALVTIIVSQALANIAVVSGAIPTTGIPLPFFSAGGSSLATTLTIAGLIVNISRHTGESEHPARFSAEVSRGY